MTKTPHGAATNAIALPAMTAPWRFFIVVVMMRWPGSGIRRGVARVMAMLRVMSVALFVEPGGQLGAVDRHGLQPFPSAGIGRRRRLGRTRAAAGPRWP